MPVCVLFYASILFYNITHFNGYTFKTWAIWRMKVKPQTSDLLRFSTVSNFVKQCCPWSQI